MNVTNGTDDTTGTSNTSENAPTAIEHPSATSPNTPPHAEDGQPPDENPVTSSSPDRRADMDEQAVLIPPESLPAVTAMLESLGPRRVKVYELRGEVWVDLGTGFCQGFVENVLPFLS